MVFDLGNFKDMLGDWDRVRKHLATGRVRGYVVSFIDDDGKEAIFLAGKYKQDKRAALKAAMNMSMELNRATRSDEEDEDDASPEFKVSQ